MFDRSLQKIATSKREYRTNRTCIFERVPRQVYWVVLRKLAHNTDSTFRILVLWNNWMRTWNRSD